MRVRYGRYSMPGENWEGLIAGSEWIPMNTYSTTMFAPDHVFDARLSRIFKLWPGQQRCRCIYAFAGLTMHCRELDLPCSGTVRYASGDRGLGDELSGIRSVAYHA